METDIIIMAGVLGAVVMAATHLAVLEGWVDPADPKNAAANLLAAGLVFASTLVEWNTVVALLALQWGAVSLLRLGRTILNRRA